MTLTQDRPTLAASRNDLPTWWRNAAVYQIYPRSFADANGDGVGDIAGIRSRLGYLAGLGVNAIWINPWYPSPMKDAGYDVSDYRDIEPVFGTLDEADAMIAEAHALGIKVIIDIVPNHTSDQHRFFVEALAAGPGSPERDRFIFRPGRGEDGALPPNDWQSCFGGPAWTRTTNPDGTPGDWYLRLFAPEQPDVNWDNEDIRSEFLATLRFWFDRGVDGFRIDVAHGLVKDSALPDVGDLPFPLPEDWPDDVDHPHWDRPGIHEIFRTWRAVADEYAPQRAFCGEIWVGRPRRLAAYLRDDELHTAFNFDFLMCPWLASDLRTVIDATLATHAAVGAPATWVLGNHDVCRPVSRYARDQRLGQPMDRNLVHFLGRPADLDAGLRRARAAALLMLALPGSAYIYEGEELGLPEVEDIPLDAMQDPTVKQTFGADPGRDGCRVPIPWDADASGNYGFSPAGASAPWLPQPSGWGERSVSAEQGVPGSTLELYRSALAIRNAHPALGDGDMQWLDSPADVLAFSREPGFACWVNVGPEPVALPADAKVLVRSGDLTADGALPSDTAVWLELG
ncbi:MAG: glycoside hydrolase family 13 protein [Propionibacteriaceae bacterium]|nr:glycoside hydrolase family 13 protein [Propionibacteriaceae bacterium]